MEWFIIRAILGTCAGSRGEEAFSVDDVQASGMLRPWHEASADYVTTSENSQGADIHCGAEGAGILQNQGHQKENQEGRHDTPSVQGESDTSGRDGASTRVEEAVPDVCLHEPLRYFIPRHMKMRPPSVIAFKEKQQPN